MWQLHMYVYKWSRVALFFTPSSDYGDSWQVVLVLPNYITPQHNRMCNVGNWDGKFALTHERRLFASQHFISCMGKPLSLVVGHVYSILSDCHWTMTCLHCADTETVHHQRVLPKKHGLSVYTSRLLRRDDDRPMWYGLYSYVAPVSDLSIGGDDDVQRKRKRQENSKSPNIIMIMSRKTSVRANENLGPSSSQFQCGKVSLVSLGSTQCTKNVKALRLVWWMDGGRFPSL